MKKIYKDPIYVGYPQYIRASKFLHVGVQEGHYYVRSEHEEGSSELWEVLIVGTGMVIPNNSTHVGTIQDRGYVWHVYARPE